MLKEFRILTLLSVLLMASGAQATRIGMLDYALHSDLTATVTGGSEAKMDAGTISIPTHVSYNEKIYKVTAIEDKAFAGWKTLEWVKLPITMVTIGEGAFRGCTNLKFVDIDGDAMMEIKPWAFGGCTSLMAFKVPPLLKKLGNNAFDGCTNLGSINFGEVIENLEEIPAGLCKGCTSLRVVYIPPTSNIKKIRDEAFQNCAFEWILIPEKVESLGWNVFKGCKELKHISCRIMKPITINSNVFDESNYKNAVLGIPKGT